MARNTKSARNNQAQLKLEVSQDKGYSVMQVGDEWTITHDGKPVDTVFGSFDSREDAEAEIELDRRYREMHQASMRKEAEAEPKRFKVHFDVYPEYWVKDRENKRGVGHYTIAMEYFDKKPSDKELQARIKALRAESAEVWDAELPEVMTHHMAQSGKMMCPANKIGHGFSNEPLRFFHLLSRLPKEEAEHLVTSHEIDLGHKLRAKLKGPLHNDGLPRRRTCIACRKPYEAKNRHMAPPYGSVCCSFACYTDAAARKLDWVKEAIALNNVGKTKEPKPKTPKAPKSTTFHCYACNATGDRENICSICNQHHCDKHTLEVEGKLMCQWCKFDNQTHCGRCEEVIMKGTHCKQCAAVLDLEAEKAKLQPESSATEKSCPHCGDFGSIDEKFGWRIMNGKRKPQSRCKKCR